jgi:UDP-N-acetylmuramoyl-tripeptide--D-alanyl-D-alanine ligase
MTAPLWSAAELTAATGVPVAFEATGISIDTRTLEPGDLFVALVGENGDGHAHVADALAKQAAGALVHRMPEDPNGGGIDPSRLILVGDTLEGLTALGAFSRSRFGGRVVAVTGSVGKTTTKEMLRAVLGEAGRTHAAVASYNNHWGVPLTLARMPAEAAFAVIEIGMNHPGEILPLAKLARPHVGVITAIAPAHLGHMGSVEAIADEKASLLAGLEPGGIAVLPADSPHLARLRAAAGAAPVRLFGSGTDARVWLLKSISGAESNDVTALVGDASVGFRMRAPGRHMATNAMAALAVADALGLDPLSSAAALAGFAPVGGRGARRTIRMPDGEITLLDESYNASPAAVRAALAVLALQPAARRIAVLGDMLELGEAALAEHMGLAPEVASAADLLFTCGRLSRALHESVPARLRGTHAATSEELVPHLLAALRPGDTVLVKGSLGSRMKLIVQALEAPQFALAGPR